MAVIDLSEPPPFFHERRRYVRAPRPVEFPSEADVPETKRHLEARTTLYLLLKDAFAGVAIGSEQFVYWDAGEPRKCLSPDVFVKLGAREEPFDVWKIWERGAPHLAVEIVSDSDRREADWDAKIASYQASGIAEVVRFDAEDEKQPIRAWDRVEGELLERSPESLDLRACITLGLWWAVVPSAYGPQLRLARDRDGRELLPTPSEDRARLDEERAALEQKLAEERKARSVAEHERLLAEHERLLADQARLLAEERLREETEARARDHEAAQAEIERLRAEISRMRGEGR